MKKSLLLALCSVFFLGGCAIQPQLSLPDQGNVPVLLHADATLASWQDFLQALGQSDYVIIGEQHTSVCHHRVQGQVLETALKLGMRPVLGLEMLPAESNGTLQKYQASQAEQNTHSFSQAVNWKELWGFDYALYAPVLDLALSEKLPIRGINVPIRMVKAVSKGGVGAITAEDKKWLPARTIPMPEAQAQSLAGIRNSHMQRVTMPKAAKTPTASNPNSFNEVMELWDSAMGYNSTLLSQQFQQPVFILIGQGHSSQGWGLPHTIKAFQPQAKILTLLPWDSSVHPSDPTNFFYVCGAL